MKKRAGQIINRIQLTEKSTDLGEANKYFFKVAPNANKIEIKTAIEELYGVKVDSVNTMNYTGKKKRLRTIRYGKKPDWKRAIVTLGEGDIDLT
ncbi:MAG: 50S ribosomal protein L23 [Kiritimatiellae bacterium]|jgi:large subunit ribosomal protein L23|nr:50S ribosomal protein L23 [Kiritimatiellia bacterium]